MFKNTIFSLSEIISKSYKTYSDDQIANEEGEKKWRIGDSTDQEVTDHYGKDIWTYNEGIWNLNMHMFGEPSGVIKRDDNTQACDAGAAKGTKVRNKISFLVLLTRMRRVRPG